MFQGLLGLLEHLLLFLLLFQDVIHLFDWGEYFLPAFGLENSPQRTLLTSLPVTVASTGVLFRFKISQINGLPAKILPQLILVTLFCYKLVTDLKFFHLNHGGVFSIIFN